MKIRYKKTISLTNPESYVGVKKISDFLERSGYEITSQTNQSLMFKHSLWQFSSRAKAFSKVNGGSFDIITDKRIVEFSFYISLEFEIIAIVVIIALGFIQDPKIFYFIIFIVVMFFFRMEAVKNTGDKMMVSVSNLP